MYAAFARMVCLLALPGILAPPALFAAPVPTAPTEQPARSAQVELTAESVLAFATREQGITIMMTRDDYVSRMSEFDRMLRLKSTQPVSERTYLDFVAENVLEFTPSEQTRLERLVAQLRNAVLQYQLPLPSTVVLIKTTGKEDVGQAHTRANAIVLPQRSLVEDDESLLFLLAHELFHVMSRHDANFRKTAYQLIGFRVGDEILLPDPIAPRQITNPDASRHDSYIDVTSDGLKITVIPVLLSRSAVFDPQIGVELDDFWTLRLLVVQQNSPDQAPRPVLHDGAPVLLRLKQVDDFLDQVGRNTGYIIHPEEILAENFALLITNQNVREPERLDALRQVFERQ